MAGRSAFRAVRRGLAFLWRATTPADRLLMALAWAGVLALPWQVWTAEPGTAAVVIVGDEEVRRLDLGRDGTVTVTGALGPAELEVRDGAVRFRHSPCTAKRCLHAGWQSDAGDSAACAPNRVLVRVTGQREAPWDAVNY